MIGPTDDSAKLENDKKAQHADCPAKFSLAVLSFHHLASGSEHAGLRTPPLDPCLVQASAVPLRCHFARMQTTAQACLFEHDAVEGHVHCEAVGCCYRSLHHVVHLFYGRNSWIGLVVVVSAISDGRTSMTMLRSR